MSFSSTSYNQSSRKTTSVYGGAGGHGTRISDRGAMIGSGIFGTRVSTGGAMIGSGSYSGGFNLTDGLDLHVDANEKAMLQNLNDRLATYLSKVHSMEKENERLEKQIREWYSSKTVITHDYSTYMATIADLQAKIQAAALANSRIYLEIDNSKLAADDFRMKFENELSMRQTVEGDIAGLRRVLDDLTLTRKDLDSQYESLKDELIMLKQNHEEELSQLRTQMSGKVDVNVNSPAPLDLNQTMTEIREHYEGVIGKNRRDLEQWYQNKITVVEKDVVDTSTSLATFVLEIKELKSTLQTHQIELQSQMSMKSSLESTLRETQERYSVQLMGLQARVTGLEIQKSSLDAEIRENDLKYGTLLDLKTRLEAEIVEYRRLLDGEDESASSKQVITKTMVVTETYVDGKKVSATS